MGQIHAAFSCHQKLASDRGLCVKECDFGPGFRRDLGGAQSGWSAAYDGDVFHFENPGVRTLPAKLKTAISSASLAQSRNVVVIRVWAPDGRA